LVAQMCLGLYIWTFSNIFLFGHFIISNFIAFLGLLIFWHFLWILIRVWFDKWNLG